MEDSLNKTHPSTMVPVAIGIVAAVLALAGVISAVSASKKAGALEEKIGPALEQATNSQAALEQRLVDLEAKINRIGESNAAVDRNMRGLADQTQNYLTQLRNEIVNTREGLKKNAESVQEIAEQMAKRAAPAAARKDKDEGAGGKPEGGSGGEYTVKPGDYFAKIAKALGTTTEKLQEANPGISSNKLQIGQKLNVPK